MVFTPRPATELAVAQTFNALTDQILLVRSGQLFKLAALPVGPAGADGADGPPGPSVELRTSDGFVQTRVEGSDTWTDLVSLAQISGATISAAAAVPDNQNGREGDLYINTTNGDLYEKGSSTWAVIGNVAGPQGPQGPQGDEGPAGVASGAIFGDSGDLYNDTNNATGTIVLSDISAVEYFYGANNDVFVEFIGPNIQVDLKTDQGDFDIAVKGETGGLTSRTIDVASDGSFLRISARSRITISGKIGWPPLLVMLDNDVSSAAVTAA